MVEGSAVSSYSMRLAYVCLARFAWQFPDNPHLARYLYRVNVPTLIIWGEQDYFVPSQHGQAYQEGIDDAALVVLPQCGHLPHLEQPEACLDAILDYLARPDV